MKRIKLAKHSISAFHEAKAVRILENLLEERCKIKTFFSENDKTPNHDGFFELLGEDGKPEKQFIVQIKKAEHLLKCDKGKNKGKYVYSLDTAFLHYVQERVSESPAIYFVVDIMEEKVFYIYLSDELLSGMDFENKNHISYKFSEKDIIKDVDAFTETLHKISLSRNKNRIS